MPPTQCASWEVDLYLMKAWIRVERKLLLELRCVVVTPSGLSLEIALCAWANFPQLASEGLHVIFYNVCGKEGSVLKGQFYFFCCIQMVIALLQQSKVLLPEEDLVYFIIIIKCWLGLLLLCSNLILLCRLMLLYLVNIHAWVNLLCHSWIFPLISSRCPLHAFFTELL